MIETKQLVLKEIWPFYPFYRTIDPDQTGFLGSSIAMYRAITYKHLAPCIEIGYPVALLKGHGETTTKVKDRRVIWDYILKRVRDVLEGHGCQVIFIPVVGLPALFQKVTILYERSPMQLYDLWEYIDSIERIMENYPHLDLEGSIDELRQSRAAQ